LLRLEELENRTLLTVSVGLAKTGLGYTGYYPPDTIGAIGPNYYVEAVNLTLGIYAKSTGNLTSSKALGTFFSPLGGVLSGSDPVVTYDTYTNKFVVGMLDYNNSVSRFDLAVSSTSDPTGSWIFHRYDMTHDPVSGTYFADYPRLGYTADAYVVTFNMFGNSNHVDTLSVNKSSLAGFVHAWNGNGVGQPGMAPAVVHDGSAGGPVWLVGTSGGTSIKVAKMTGELTSSPTINVYTVSVPSYGVMPNPRDPGGTMNWNFDTRILDAAARGGMLVAAHNTGSGGFARARWYEFNIQGSTPTLVQSGSAGPASTDTYFPTIDINTAGALGMTYIESSPSEFMSTYVTGRTTGDSLNQMETGVGPSALKGSSHYSLSRAGDYSAVTVDPSNGTTFWAANEYKGTSNWNTGFASFTVSGVSGATHYQLDPSDNPVQAGSTFSLTVSALDANNNIVTGYRGTVHFATTDQQGFLPANYAFTASDNGVHTFPITLATAGNQTITATDTANGSISGRATITVTPAPAASFAVYTDASDPDVAGSLFDITVVAIDPFGNQDTNYTGTATFSSQDPFGATLPVDYAFQPGDAGAASFSGVALYTAGTQDVTATDTVSGITGAAFVNVVAAPASSLMVIAPHTATSGSPFDVTVVAQDPYGNTDTNYSGTVTWGTTDMGTGVVLPPDYAFQPSDQGMVTFPHGVTLITPGDQTLYAADTVSGINGSAVVTVTMSPLTGVSTSLTPLTSLPTQATSKPAVIPAGHAVAVPANQTLSDSQVADIDLFFNVAQIDPQSGALTGQLESPLSIVFDPNVGETLLMDLPAQQVTA
jgi:hypothetical protein